MSPFACNQDVVCGFDFSKLYDKFLQNSENIGFLEVDPGGSSSPSSLVLDNEKGELVKTPAKLLGKKAISEEKTLAALKSHSEAERRRRERINSHLSMLRTLIPNADKMDKASLLAEVISHVKELQRSAIEASEGFLIPMDNDEVIVEPHDDGSDGQPFSIKASLCCDYQPELLSDLKQTIEALKLKTIKAEISTLGGRVKNIFIITCGQREKIENANDRHILMSSVHKALSSVLDRVNASAEFSPRTMYPNKRRRMSSFPSSSSSS